MKSFITIPPVKKVDEEMLTRLESKAPMGGLSLKVRAGLAILDEMSAADLNAVLNKQRAREMGHDLAKAVAPIRRRKKAAA